MNDLIRNNRKRLEWELRDSPQRRFFSPILYSQYRVTLPLIQRFATGKLIDVGCGAMPYRALIIPLVKRYDTLDLYPQMQTTFVGDVHNMPMVSDAVYETVLCLEVLEHLADPPRALKEIHRILKPGGTLILSVPHLSRLHEQPHDYFRFTHYGISALLARSGFECVVIEKRGGLFSFLGHQVATILLGTVWGIPLLKQIVWFLNSWLVTRLCVALDTVMDRDGILAAGYSAVARKKWEHEIDVA